MYKKNQYVLLLICIPLILIVFFGSPCTSSPDTKENEQASCNALLNNQNTNNIPSINNGTLEEGKSHRDQKQGQEVLNNVEILVKPFVLVFQLLWSIASYSYQITSICLYPAVYVFKTFYNTFIYKPYTVVKWVISTFFPLYLFCLTAAVIGCFVGGASGWLSEVIVTFLNSSSSPPPIDNNNSNKMIVDENDMNNSNVYEDINNNNANDNMYYPHNNDYNNYIYESDFNNNNFNNNNYNNGYYDEEENNNDGNSYYDDGNSNYDTNSNYDYNNYYDGNNSDYYGVNNNNNNGVEYNDNNDYNDDDEDEATATTSRIQEEENKKKYEKLRRRIAALAELKAKNGGRLPDEFIAKYRKATSGYSSGAGVG